MRFASLASSLVLLLSSAVLAAQGDALVVTGDGVNVRARPEAGAPILLQAARDDVAVELARQGDWVEVRLPDQDIRGWIHGSLLAVAGDRPAAAAAPVATGQPAVATAPAEVPPTNATTPPVAITPPVAATPSVAPPPAAATPAAPAVSEGAPAPEPGNSQVAAVGGPDSADAVDRFRASVIYLNNRAVAAAGIDLFTDVTGRGDGVVQVTATDAWTTVPEGGKESFMNTLYDRWLAAAGATQPLRVEVVDRAGQVLRQKSGP